MALETKKHTLEQLAKLFGIKYSGSSSILIDGVATLQNASVGKISFFANKKYKSFLADTKASAVIINDKDIRDYDKPCLITDNPYLVFAKIATLFQSNDLLNQGIHPSAIVEETAIVEPGASIGALAYIGHNAIVKPGASIRSNAVVNQGVTIGKKTVIHSGAVINNNVKIGDRVIIHSGAIIGADGFGLAKDGNNWFKVPQLGSVVIGDDCEIGANTTIDRGAIEDTILEHDVRLDNQIQIGHNVYIGAHTAIAGCAGISGSAKIGKHCLIGGGVGIVGHIEITDSVIIAGGCVVTKSINEPGHYASGMPFDEYRTWRKNAARIRQLDTIAKRLKQLEKTTNNPN